MKSFSILPTVLFSMFLFFAFADLQAAPTTDRHVFRAGTKAFKKHEAKLKHNAQQASELLSVATTNRTDAYSWPDPLFIVGTEYMFGFPRKDRLPLKGFYVDGNTGRVTKKTSTRSLKWYNTRLPKNPYDKEEVISNWSEVRPQQRDGKAPDGKSLSNKSKKQPSQ